MMDFFGSLIVPFLGFDKYYCIVPQMKDKKDNKVYVLAFKP
jgi:hypothetical protein